jgi:hypothetical protein
MIMHQARMLTGGVKKPRRKPAVRPSESMPPRPNGDCRGRLHTYPTVQTSYDSMTGLDHLRCEICGHLGMRVPNGLHFVFRGPDEYVFQYPPSLASLTIAVSPSFLTPFTCHGFSPIQVVTFMVKWMLLTGRVNGTVLFTDEKVALKDCYDYFLRHMVREGGAQTP